MEDLLGPKHLPFEITFGVLIEQKNTTIVMTTKTLNTRLLECKEAWERRTWS